MGRLEIEIGVVVYIYCIIITDIYLLIYYKLRKMPIEHENGNHLVT